MKISDFVLLAVSLLALLGQAAAAESPAVNLGVNLLNESCEARERDDLAERVGIPTDRQIYCDGNLAGQLAYGQLLSGGNQNVEAARAALLSQYERSAMARVIASRASCAAATWVEASGAATVAMLPCQLKLGGWPHLVQLVAETVIDLLNQGTQRNADTALLERALDKAVVSGDTVLRELVERECRLPGEWDYLRAFRSADTQPPPLDEGVERSLRRRLLIAVDRDGQWRLRVPLMQRWLRERS